MRKMLMGIEYTVKGSRGACGVWVIVEGNGHGDPSSNPSQSCLNYPSPYLEKGMNPTILPPAIRK